MEELAIFNFGGNEVRTIEVDGEVWWVAKDVCDVLEIRNTTQAVNNLDDDERSMFKIGRQGKANIINEFGLFSLILSSRKKQAKEFKRWVTHEVLPSIRKTGFYETTNRAIEVLEQSLLNAHQENRIMQLEIDKKEIELKQACIFLADGNYGDVSNITGKEKCIPVKGYFRTGKPKSKAICNVVQQYFEFGQE